MPKSQKTRNLSFHEYVKDVESSMRPSLGFSAKHKKSFPLWRQDVRKKVTELFGDMPTRKVAPRVKVIEQRSVGSYIRRKIVFDVESNFSIPAYLLIPKGLKKNRSAPAILALHGHGRGKRDICRIDTDPRVLQQFIRPLRYDYAHRFANDGYVVLAPDARGFGEISDLTCTEMYTTMTLLGKTVVGIRVWDAMRAVDVLVSQPEVDPKRLGCTGLSWGGTHTMYTTLTDKRIKTACVSGYFSDIKDVLIDYPQCPCQYLPGLRKFVDFPDIMGAIAPRPLLIQNGDIDALYCVEIVQEEFKKVAEIYKAARASDKVALDLFYGAHEYNYETAVEWFRRWL